MQNEKIDELQRAAGQLRDARSAGDKEFLSAAAAAVAKAKEVQADLEARIGKLEASNTPLAAA